MALLLKALGGAVVVGVIWFIRGVRPGHDNQRREEEAKADEAGETAAS